MAGTALQVLLSPLLGTVFDSLGSILESEFDLFSGVQDEFQKLLLTVSTVKDVIEDAEAKQLTEKPICNWLKKLKEVVYEVDDFLDECNTDALLRSSSEILEPSSTIAKQVESFIQRFEKIKKLRKFHLNSYVTAADVQLGKRQQRETSSYTDEPTVYGREEDIENIVTVLKNDAAGSGNDHQRRDVSVYAIVGMGGLGKTTLAQEVYHDERIQAHFAVKCWICVSEDFDPKRFIKTILESLGEGFARDQQHTMDYLQSRLKERLGGKKFLLVLDDVWSKDPGMWDTLKTSLRCGGDGSFVLVTTRHKKVASIMATQHYSPKPLSEEDCWSLLKHRANLCDEEENYRELEAVGRKIVKKCSGIPLAAKALGGLLRFKREYRQWLNVNESQIWELEDNTSDAILPALQLSYKHLTSQMKQCFAYCSIYPKDYPMSKEVLISSWMAHGFIQPKGLMDFEDVGNEIFDDLSWGSFFQDFRKDEEGNIICKMHDLMHDLACSIMRDECLLLHHNKANSHISSTIGTARYVSLNSISISDYPFLKSKLHQNHIRELYLLQPVDRSNIPTFLEFIFSHLTFLRVLTLKQFFGIDTIPESIGNLKLLRYLNLSNMPITSLPNDICCLINLQILKLRNCSQLSCLPPGMKKMTNLRDLDITGCSMLTKMPIEMGKLIFLHTLGLFIVGKESGCGITELKDLQHLKGALTIRGLEHVKNETDARNSNLIQRPHLQSLDLRWSYGSADTEEEEQAQLMVGEGLQPDPNLKKLSISGYEGVRFPNWIGVSSCLPNLVEINLSNCPKCEHLPQLGNLPHLKILGLSNLYSVKCISEFYHQGDQAIPLFPSLQELIIYDMCHFGEILSPSSPSSSSNPPRRIQSGDQAQEVSSFPCLRNLIICYCPKLTSFISLPPSLHILVLRNTHEELLLRYLEQSSSFLKDLQISGFPNLASFPVEEQVHNEGGLIDLTHLSVAFCPKLETLHMNNGSRHLANLQDLELQNCPELDFSHEDDDAFQNLVSLRGLELNGLDKMTYFPRLPSLASLRIENCSALTTLQEWMPNLTSLEYLDINNCKNLISLSDGLQRLTALTDLRIVNCENLKSLPDEIERLTALSSLTIIRCHPDLHRQCRNEEGQLWGKILHIPELHIDIDDEE